MPQNPANDVTPDPLYERVRTTVAEAYRVESSTLRPETHFGYDLNDSLEIVQVLLVCEEAFDVEVPDQRAAGLATLGELVDYLRQALHCPSPPA